MREDSCGQCIRASLSCSGYRKSEELRIVDETKKVEHRALSHRSKEVPQALAAGLGEKARAAFFTHYVSGVTKSYDVLQSLYERPGHHGHLVASVNAVSLAYFAFQFDAPSVLQQAKEQYVKALPVLNTALQTFGTSRSDESLAAVLLLDLFEKMVNRNPRSRDSWMSHVNGALALVRLRDRTVFQKYIDLRLSVRLYINLLISCVAADAPVPPALGELRSDLELFLNKNDPKWQLTGLVSEYANIRQLLNEEPVRWPVALAHIAKLDSDCIRLVKNMPPIWLYQRNGCIVSPVRLLEDHFDTYADPHITQTWNVLRVIRIMLNDTVYTYCITHLDSKDDQSCTSMALKMSKNIVDTLAKDICASSPQYTSHAKPPLVGVEQSGMEKLRCHTLLFPLYVAAMYASSMTGVITWVINHLKFMSSEMGIQNAATIAKMLKSGEMVEPWRVYAMLGSYAFAT